MNQIQNSKAQYEHLKSIYSQSSQKAIQAEIEAKDLLFQVDKLK